LTGAVRHWMGEDYWGIWTADQKRGLDGFKHNQQPLTDANTKKCSMKTTMLRFSQIVTPFPVFQEHWDPNAVITLGDDQGRALDVKLLELLCFTRTRYKNKVRDARKRKNKGLSKRVNMGCRSI